MKNPFDLAKHLATHVHEKYQYGGTVEDIETALLDYGEEICSLQRDYALEDAAIFVEDGANGYAGRDTRYDIAEQIRTLKKGKTNAV